MSITNISSLIFLEDFTSTLNRDVRKKSKRLIKKQASIVIDEKFIKKNKKHNNANVKFVD